MLEVHHLPRHRASRVDWSSRGIPRSSIAFQNIGLLVFAGTLLVCCLHLKFYIGTSSLLENSCLLRLLSWILPPTCSGHVSSWSLYFNMVSVLTSALSSIALFWRDANRINCGLQAFVEMSQPIVLIN